MCDGWHRIGDRIYFNGWYVFTFPKEMTATQRQLVEQRLGVPLS